MNTFLYNIILAFAWAALIGELSIDTIFTGLVLGFVALWLSAPLTGLDRRYFKCIFRALRLAVYFVSELVKSSVNVARDVLRPVPQNKPAIIEVALSVESDIEIFLLTSLITLTPGTISLDVTPDLRTLYVHAMFADDPESEVEGIKQGFERMVKEVFE